MRENVTRTPSAAQQWSEGLVAGVPELRSRSLSIVKVSKW